MKTAQLILFLACMVGLIVFAAIGNIAVTIMYSTFAIILEKQLTQKL